MSTTERLSEETRTTWHTRSSAESASLLKSDPDRGLSDAEARARLQHLGPNVVSGRGEEPWWREVLESLTEPLVLLLIAVGALYAILGEIRDAITIFFVIVTVGVVETANELRAKRAVASLSSLQTPMATVVRDGALQEIFAAEVVPGDLVLLQSGARVPADVRLVDTAALRADESSLTGESVPVAKEADAQLSSQTELGDRRNLAFAGTLITSGKGRGLVYATGAATEIGRIVGLTQGAQEGRTPLQQQMRQLAGWLLWLALGFSVLVPFLGVVLAHRPVQEMLLTGLTLAFATIPEELPILITIVLGLGAYQLAKQRAIVKHLRAAETLGTVTAIGTDKTGTLTENRMRVAEVRIDGEPQSAVADVDDSEERLFQIGILASDAQLQRVNGRVELVGDPTETALLLAAEDAGIGVDRVRASAHILEEYPFDDLRKRMSVVYAQDGRRVLASKGSPESILAVCTHRRTHRGAEILGPEQRQSVQAAAEEMAAGGLRVLAFAERTLTVPDQPAPDPAEVERGLTLVGLAGLEDPPRPEVPAAIATLKGAGVRVLMLTGDHPATGRAIAQKVGIDATRVVRGHDLEDSSDQELERCVERVSVFARITPEHKLRIVRALQRQGEIVAVTGDGVNDAPALKEAAIGVAMGRTGTEIAREAADLVLADDNFATVTVAVRSGRTLFANLRKAVRYYLAAKVGLIAASLVPVLFLDPVPFAPVQIIILELFMDLGASTTFVAEPAESDLMAQPPRDPRRPFMDRSMTLGILAGGLSLAAAVLVAYFWTLAQGLPVAQTAAFATWIIGHLVLAAHMRSERQPLLGTNPFANRPFLLWTAGAIAMLVLGMTVPFVQERLHLASLSLADWGVVLAAAVLLPSWWEIAKWTGWRRRP